MRQPATKRSGGKFAHEAILAERYDAKAITRELAQGGHFFDANASWNRSAPSP